MYYVYWFIKPNYGYLWILNSCLTLNKAFVWQWVFFFFFVPISSVCRVWQGNDSSSPQGFFRHPGESPALPCLHRLFVAFWAPSSVLGTLEMSPLSEYLLWFLHVGVWLHWNAFCSKQAGILPPTHIYFHLHKLVFFLCFIVMLHHF